MDIDLRNVPFSRYGAYLAFSILPQEEGQRTAGGPSAGLFLRSVHGSRPSGASGGRLALLEVTLNGQPLPYEVRCTPAGLYLNTVRGTVSICMAEPTLIRVRGEGVGLRLTFSAQLGDFAIPGPEGRWRVNCPAHMVQLMFSQLAGRLRVDAPWDGIRASQVVIDLFPETEDGLCETVLEEYSGEWRPRSELCTFEESVTTVQKDFNQWLSQAPELPAQYQAARRLAAYITWSSVVEPAGHFLRPAMFMSKNWMTNVWSWDHCFNAMALTYHKPVAAWDQLMLAFDLQDEHGCLPDFFNDRSMLWNFCKPPIHGWALNWMMEHTEFIRSDQRRQIYGPLCRWTEWWLRDRDDDRDGVPQYHHGNDSGWDNATPFQAGLPLESPDLCAYLVLQMETLAKLASGLNNAEEAESWQRRASELLERMLAHFWQGDHFVAMRSGDHLVADSESLFLYLPLILGKRLPGAVRRELLAGLTRPGRFLTPYGLATESPASSDYQPDGYWRGPIWAPSTLILVEGLNACGETALAADIARRFCDLCAANGFAENFDALTGAALRDRAYTWTASAFLVLGHDYLMGRNGAGEKSAAA